MDEKFLEWMSNMWLVPVLSSNPKVTEWRSSFIVVFHGVIGHGYDKDRYTHKEILEIWNNIKENLE